MGIIYLIDHKFDRYQHGNLFWHPIHFNFPCLIHGHHDGYCPYSTYEQIHLLL